MWSALSSAGKIKVVASSIIIAAIIPYFIWIETRSTTQIHVDDHGCLYGQAVSAHTLILVDNTDPFSEPQIATFMKTIQRVRENVQPWEMVSIGIIRDLPTSIIFSRCSPENVRSGSVWDIFNRPNQNWLLLKAEFQQKFSKPLQTQVDTMPLNTSAPQSPIVQTLQDVTDQLGKYWRKAKSRNIIIFSDLMENTPEFSQYSSYTSKLDFQAASQTVSYLRDSIDLDGASVKVFYLIGLPHDKPYQGRLHQRFWQELFRQNGAKDIEFEDLPFGSPTSAQN